MDITSYLLGKQSSSGGGSDLDWNAIGYSKIPQEIIDGYNLAVKIKNEWTDTSKLTDYRNVLICPMVDIGSYQMSYFASSCTKLISVPLLDTSNATAMNHVFYNCSALTTVPLFDTGNATNMVSMFSGCVNLTTVPQFDTSKVTSMQNMFSGCSALTTVPQFDTSKVTTIDSMFNNCTTLSDESLNNILAMCINMTSYTGTKTLKLLGIRNATLKNKIPTLSNYQAFLDAGWTIE